MQDLLLSTFNSLRQRRIRYCLLRDGDRLEQYEQGGEIDMLVAKNQFRELKEALSLLGFTHIPAWGHAPPSVKRNRPLPDHSSENARKRRHAERQVFSVQRI